MRPNLRRPPYRTYSITQLCREFGVTARALRFYEEQGLVFPGRRDLQRVYSYKDRARLALVVRGRRVGLSLAQIRDILDLYEEEGAGAQNTKALDIFRERIAELEAQRKDVDEAIATLERASQRLAGVGIAAE
ncbi:MerR family DNA-binding transcriptional regulator [Phenylobacterium sp. J367]|uniref:MerR family transcriptional regulator n=1 Tax=Phenylobacterium sp. J367 TaxID=2898435 RepID=UPI002151F74A|nr:MerR family DNA-binding transcriptional regulator [Phenylobacterium sp. J367]MCR5881065.1 MerR family DNA-binding transcriptional regulator [Phenylobacterium sp. J367]